MKAQELRIGNWYLGNGDYPEQITSKDIVELSDDPLDDYYEPMPLTEEWLLNFGFEQYGHKNENNPMELRVKDIVFHIYSPSKDHNKKHWHTTASNGFSHRELDVKHVHQLQNLYFALTGEELETK